MKKFLLFILFSLGISIYHSSAQYSGMSWSWNTLAFDSLFYKSGPANDNFTMPYRLLKPQTYNPMDQTTRYPLVIMLHGRGEGMGTTCSAQRGINLCQLGWGGKMELDSVGKYPAFYMHPQVYGGGWASADGTGNFTEEPERSIRVLVELLDFLFRTYPIDLNRVYIHGLSGGGHGVWEMLFRYPGLFAATSPHSAAGKSDWAKTVLYNPIWTVQGENDVNPVPAFSMKMIDSLEYYGASPIFTYDETTGKQVWSKVKKDAGNPIYTLVPNIGHEAWISLYNSPAWLNWMFSQNKLKIKVWNNGDKGICQNANDSRLIGISPGFEQYEWRKDGVVIANSNVNSLNVTEPGGYSVRYKKKQYFFSGDSEWTNWSDTVKIYYKAPTPTVAITQLGSTALPSLDGKTSVQLSAPAGYNKYLWSNGATTQNITVSTEGSYSVQVTVTNGCISNPSQPKLVTVGTKPNTPLAPSNLTAVGTSTKNIKLFWDDNANNETGFEVFHSATAGGPYIYRRTIPANTVIFIDSLLSQNTTYYYKVRAINANGGSAYTGEKYAKTVLDNTLPTIPALTITAKSSTSATLSWTASTDNYGINKYIIYTGTKAVDSTDATTITLNLKRDTSYTITVRAKDNTGLLSNPSNQVSLSTTLNGVDYNYYEGSWSALPNFSTLTPVKTGTVATFTLTPKLKGDYFGFSFKGYINITTAGTYKFFTSSDDGSKLYINNNLIVNNDGLHATTEQSGTVFLPVGRHAIRVDFFEAAGGEVCEVRYEGPGVSKVIIPTTVLYTGLGAAPVPPVAVTSLQATQVSSSKIRITWTNSTPNVNFEVYRTNSTGQISTLIYTGPSTATTFTDSGLNPATKYFYKIKSISAGGETTFPTIVNAFTAAKPAIPNAPAGLTAQVISYSQVNLSWTDSNNEDFFIIERAELNSNNFTPIDSVGANVLTYSNINMESNTKFYYRVRAKNDGGYSAYTSTVQIITLPNIPAVPTDLASDVKSVLKINLSWKDNATNEDGFKLEKSSSFNSGFVEIATLPANATTYTDGGTENTTYYYRLKAFNAHDGISEYSQVLTVVVPVAPYAPNTGNWKIQPVSVVDNGGSADLVSTLMSKKDYLQKLTMTPGSNRSISVKLPAMATDGMFIFNIENNISSVQITAFTSTNSTNGVDGTWTALASPYVSSFENDLQKMDLPKTLGGSWVRLSFQNNFTGNVLLKEFGLYQFSPSGRDNYFLICGASIEEAMGSHAEIRNEIEAAFPGQGYEPVIFNLSVGGQNAAGLAITIDDILARHPHASYVFVHQGGNNVTPKRPLLYADLYNSYTKTQFVGQFNKIATSILNAGKVPVIARISFRDYKETPLVNGGLNQEVGSLPFNILVDDVIKKYSPEFYNNAEKKGRIDLYELTINNQSLLTPYDGIHPLPSQTDKFIKYWINSAVRYIYKGQWNVPAPYLQVVPNLEAKAEAAVVDAELSYKGIDWYKARILTEQIGNSIVRVPLLTRLEAIDTNYVPSIPVVVNNLAASAMTYKKINITWSDLSNNELGYDVYRATSLHGTYTKIFTSERNVTSYSDSTLNQTTTYYYKVRGFNKGGFAAYSNIASATTLVKPFVNSRPVFTPIVNPSVKEANTLVIPIKTNDVDPDQIVLKAYGVPAFATFIDSLNGRGSIIVNPGLTDAGTYNLSLSSNDGQGGKDSINFVLTVLNNVEETILYRINTGGAAIADPAFNWAADTKDAPISYLDAASPNLTQAYNFNAINYTDAPNQLFALYRYGTTSVPIGYNLPVPNGYFRVKLYFWSKATAAGQRVIHAKLEGTQVLTAYDPYVEVGGNAVMKTFYVNVTDGILDVDIIKYIGNPSICGIEVVKVVEPAPNKNPVIAPIENQVIIVDNNLTIGITSIDLDGDIPTLTISGLPSYATFVNNEDGTANLVISPSESNLGTKVMTVTANDQKGGIATKAFTVSVIPVPPVNHGPAFVSVVPQTVTIPNNITIGVSATDEDGDAFTFSITNLPSFVTFNDNGNGSGSLVVNPGSGNAGLYSITITATDERGAISTQEISLRVNSAPVLVTIAPQVVFLPFSLSIPVLATDADLDTLVLSATNLPSFAVFTSNVDGTGTINVNPQTDDLGVYSITLTASDNNGGSASLEISLTVNPKINHKPVLSLIEAQTVLMSTSSTVNIVATDEDEDPLVYSIDDLPEFMSFTDYNNGTASLFINPTPADLGAYTVNLTVTDGKGGVTTEAVSVTVVDAINHHPVLVPVLAQSVVIPNSLAIPIGATDEDGDTLTLVVNNLPDFATFTDNGDGTGAVVVNPVVNSAGSYSFGITASDGKGGTATQTISLIVTGAPINHNPVVASVVPQAVTIPNSLNIGISATDEDGDTITLSAINLPSFATFTDNGNGTASVVVSPGTGNAGAYTITISAADNKGGTASQSILLTVNAPVNHDPVIASVEPQTVTIPNSLTVGVSATDVDGDTLALSATDLPSFATFVDNGNGTGSIVVNPITNTQGIYNVTITANDNKGGLVSSIVIITVNAPALPVNKVPVINPIAAQNVTVPNSLTIRVVSTDEDGDIASLSVDNLPSFAVFTDSLNGNGSIVFTPSVSNIGTYSFTVFADDHKGGVANKLVNLIVVGPPDQIVYRVNAGAAAITASPINWSIDTKASPSPYLDLVANTTNLVSGTPTYTGINNTDAPNDLFGTYRYSTTLPLQYNFPVTNGNYKVKLYFMPKVTASGQRFVNIRLENIVVAQHMDYYTEAGADLPFQKTFLLKVNDGVLDVDIVRVYNNPTLCGIEILSTSDVPPIRFGYYSSDNASAESFNVSLSPNPAADILKVEFNEELDQAFKIALLDEMGKVVMEMPSELYPSGEANMDIAALKPGIYLVNVTKEDGASKTLKVVKK